MAKEQLYGIRFPFTNDSWRGSFVDMNESDEDRVKSEILHIIFTPKGQRLRMPDFGSDIIKYIFEPNDSESWEAMKNDIRNQISHFLPNVMFRNISIYEDENNINSTIAVITYSVKEGSIEKEYKITVPVI